MFGLHFRVGNRIWNNSGNFDIFEILVKSGSRFDDRCGAFFLIRRRFMRFVLRYGGEIWFSACVRSVCVGEICPTCFMVSGATPFSLSDFSATSSFCGSAQVLAFPDFSVHGLNKTDFTVALCKVAHVLVGNPGFTVARGFNPAGGTPGGG
ncbi:ankyrin-1-like [Dorcoceras hygrometricum]|uniref:Ankyrin-1-like n=1 Tax=Dorcoceras hygrometricum TaxID=472368 RepID=A0A2Z7D455_9LAMI|nr:ankyrin-1-like [Dorcoceras hygrometricum]